jgi:hypothetical protein
MRIVTEDSGNNAGRAAESIRVHWQSLEPVSSCSLLVISRNRPAGKRLPLAAPHGVSRAGVATPKNGGSDDRCSDSVA